MTNMFNCRLKNSKGNVLFYDFFNKIIKAKNIKELKTKLSNHFKEGENLSILYIDNKCNLIQKNITVKKRYKKI